jgi:hypothetical protein
VCTAEGSFNDCWRNQQQSEELCAVNFHDDDDGLSLEFGACCRLCLLATPDRSFDFDRPSNKQTTAYGLEKGDRKQEFGRHKCNINT